MRKIKIWTDGSINETKNVGIAAWISDTGYRMVTHIPECTSIEIEVIAVIKAIRWALNGGFNRIYIFTDCLTIVNTLKNPQTYIKPRSWITPLVEILNTSKVAINIDFINRGANRAADALCRQENRALSKTSMIDYDLMPYIRVERFEPKSLRHPLRIPAVSRYPIKIRALSKKARKDWERRTGVAR